MRGKSHQSCERWPKTTPMCLASSRRCRSGFSSATLISPLLGTRIPVNILIVVLLPAPFGPTRPIISPRSTESERSCTASTLRTSGSTTLRTAPNNHGLLRATRNVFLSPLALIIVMFYLPFLFYSFDGDLLLPSMSKQEHICYLRYN